MSLNWVTRQDNRDQPFVPLPGEVVQHAQPEEVVVRLTPLNQPGAETIAIQGKIYLTSHRVVVLSNKTTVHEADNFSLLYRDVFSHKLDIPWFGSNKYVMLFRISNQNGGLNYLYQWEARVVFNQGGAMTYAERFAQLKTRFDNNQEDELPAYSEQ